MKYPQPLGFTLDGVVVAAGVVYDMPPYDREMLVFVCPLKWRRWIIRYINGPVGKPFSARVDPLDCEGAEMYVFQADGYTYVWMGEEYPVMTLEKASAVAHESVHVAAAILFGTGQQEILTPTNQEPFAYLLQQAAYAILTAFETEHENPVIYVPLVDDDPGVYFDSTHARHREALALHSERE